MDRRRDDNRGGGRDFSRSNGRDYNGGGYNKSSQGSSSSGHSPYDRGSSYGSSYRGGRGRGGGGYGAPGGRSGADDSTTTSLPSRETEVFSITELARLPPLPSKKSTTIRTNGYEIDTSKATVAYQYDIKWTAETKKGKKFDMNTQTKDDVKFQLKQNALRSIFFTTIHEFKEFFRIADGGDEKYSYDSGSIFFTQEKLLDDKEIRTFDLEVEKFEPCVNEYYRGLAKATAEICLTKVIRPDMLTGDHENDRPVIQYLELVLSQAQRRSGDYLSFNNKFYDKRSNEEIERTPLVLKEGVTRSVRIIGEPSDNKLMVQMVPTKTTFYDGRSVLTLIQHALKGRLRDSLTDSQLKFAHDAVKSLCLRTTHLERNFLVVAAGLTKEPANRCTFEYKDEQTNVAQYFLDKYLIRLQHPDLPCVIEKKGKDISYHPVELLRIPDGQRVPKAKQDNDLNSLIIRKCQMLPAVNVEKIEKNREEAEILNSNMIIKKTGARVDPRRLVTAPACQLLTPSIVLKDTQKSLNNGVFGMQTNDKFIHPATVRKVAFVLASEQLEPRRAEDFVKDFLRRLVLYGVRIDEHDFFDWRNPNQDYEKLADYVKNDYDFAFIIGDTDSLHHGMKYMEIGTKLPTQNIKTKTVLKSNNTLLDNLAFKFNLKAGGSNWAVTSDSSLVSQHQNRDLLKSLMSNTLFFGIDLSHPLGRADPNLKAEHADPSCVGFASNLYKGQANMSKGDVGYQCPQQTIVNATLLEEKFGAAINAYFRNSGCYPSWIVVYRAGLSEAEVKKIQNEEVPVLKETIAKLKSHCPEFGAAEVKLTVIMANTNSNFRLFKDQIDTRDKAPMQNVPSGTCVFEKIVSRRVPSFILVAQRALIGTARPAVFHILEGADAFPLDQIRYVTYALCFTHGIVTSPTKLPGPLVSAADLSKRARNNFRHQKFHGVDDNQSVSSGDSVRYRQGQGDILSEEEKKALDDKADSYYAQLNEALKATIDESRFWA